MKSVTRSVERRPASTRPKPRRWLENGAVNGDLFFLCWRRSQVVRRRSAKPLFGSSNLPGASHVTVCPATGLAFRRECGQLDADCLGRFLVRKMDSGDEFRSELGRGEALAALGNSCVRQLPKDPDEPQSRTAHLFDSLKRQKKLRLCGEYMVRVSS